MIEENVYKNGGRFYINEVYEEVECEIKKMEKELIIKMWKEVEEKFEVLGKLEDKFDVKD